MKKDKKPDYLTLCSIAAQKAGTSYGKARIPPTNSGRCGGRGSPAGHVQNLSPVRGGIHAGQNQAENLLQFGVPESPRPESRSKEIPR